MVPLRENTTAPMLRSSHRREGRDMRDRTAASRPARVQGLAFVAAHNAGMLDVAGIVQALAAIERKMKERK